MYSYVRANRTAHSPLFNCELAPRFLLVHNLLANVHCLARFIVEVVDQMDISGIESQYTGGGSEGYPPKMLITLRSASFLLSSQKRLFLSADRP